jgi:hypothetical protein
MAIQDITQDITALPTPPTTSDPDNFDVNADAFLLALDGLADEMGVLIPQLNTFGDEANALAASISDDKDIIVEKEALVNPHYVAIDNIYSNIGNINDVNSNESNINAVQANESNINTNATNIADINTNATNITSISTAATNIGDIVTAANNLSVYQNAQNVVNYKGDWIAGYETTGYSLGDVVSYSDGFKYQSKVDNNLTEPTSQTTTSEWFYQEIINDDRYYTQSEVDTALGLKADQASTYTKSEVDIAIGNIDLSTKQDVVANVSSTEIGYLDGVTGSIQTQINSKQSTLVSGTNIKTVNGVNIVGSGGATIYDNTKIGATNYATSTVGGTVKVRLNGTTAYITNNGSNA